jgi:DNA-binding LacI/PurR family transcriptional regulator
MTKRRATSYDVARQAGVSQSAVSRCFKKGASISAKTREKVMAAAQALNYYPNAIARGLITQRSNLVAVIISNLTNLYYPEVLAELTQRLSDTGVRVLLFTIAAESDVDEMLDQVWQYRVDGAIVAARLDASQLAAFADRGVPVVLYNRVVEGVPVASIRCDSMAGVTALMDGLLASDHKCFGIISGPNDNYVSTERVHAAVLRLNMARHDYTLIEGQFDYESGEAGLKEIMRRTRGKVDAVVCANDLMAVGAIDCARAHFWIVNPFQNHGDGDLACLSSHHHSPACPPHDTGRRRHDFGTD